MAILAHAGGDHGPIDFDDLPEDVALDGSASSTDTGTITEYLWSIVGAPAGHGATLSDATAETPTLEGVDIPGDYVLFLVVRDSMGNISAGGYDDGGSLAVSDYDLMDTVPDAFSVTVATTENADLELPDDLLLKEDWGDAYRALVAALDSLFGTVSSYTGDAHAPDDHAAEHETGGGDPIAIENLGTTELDDSYVLNPDGAGGVAWGPAGAATVPDPLTLGELHVSTIQHGGVVTNVGTNDLGFDNDDGDIELIASGDVILVAGGSFKTDGIVEHTADAGVTIEGVKLKDNSVEATSGDVTAGGYLLGFGVKSNSIEPWTAGGGSGAMGISSTLSKDITLTSDNDLVINAALTKVDRLVENTAANGVDIEDCNVTGLTVSADAIGEVTPDAGVQIDGARIKDGVVRDKNSHMVTFPVVAYPSTTDWESIATLRAIDPSEVPAYLGSIGVECWAYTFGYSSGTLQLRLMIGDKEVVGTTAFTPDAVPGGQLLYVSASLIQTNDTPPYGSFFARGGIEDLTNGGRLSLGGDGGGGGHSIDPTTSDDIVLQAKWSVADSGNQIKIAASHVRITRREP